MSEEFPLYPDLTEAGKEEAQRLMNSFKPKILSLVRELMDDLYCDVAIHIETDSWTSYRNYLMNGFRNYHNKGHDKKGFETIRKEIYKEFREELIPDLNQDLLKEIEDLKHALKHAEEVKHRY